MKITWIHGVRKLRGASMDKWVDSIYRELSEDESAADLDIVIDEIEGIPSPFFKGIVNRYFLYSMHCFGMRSDLFHVHDHANAHLIPLLPHGSPKIVTVHDLYLLEHPMSQITSYPFRLLNVPGIKKADHIIAVSSHMKREISRRLDWPADQISVIYCGIDHSLYRPESGGWIPAKYGLDEQNRYVLFVGSEIPRKNFPAALRSFKMLTEDYDDLCLVKVGNPGPARARENSLREIARLGLEEKVIFCGFVPEQELPGFYANAALLLAPSLYEGGSGIHVIEAMACGCPVVASSIPQSRELSGDAVLHADPHDESEIHEKAASLLANGRLRQEMIARGLARAQEFSWQRSAREHLDIYRRFHP